MTTPKPPAPPPPPVGQKPITLTVVSLASLGTAVGLGTLQFVAPQIAHGVPGVFGTISSWISAGGIMGILSLLVWAQMGNRRISVEEQAARNADRADVRDHYADEVAALRMRLDEASERHANVITEMEARHANSVLEIESKYRGLLHDTEEHYQRLLHETEEAHEICKRDRDALRGELGALREEIRGLREQIRTQATDRVLALGDPGRRPPSRAVSESARRVRNIGKSADRDRNS